MVEDNSQEKTEEASERKLERARESGEVPRSKELTMLAVLFLGIFGIYLICYWQNYYLVGLTNDCWHIDRVSLFDESGFFQKIRLGIFYILGILWLPLLLMWCSCISGFLLGGFNISFQVIVPKLERLDPISGLLRIFSQKTLFELLKSLLKFILVGFVMYFVLSYYLPRIIDLAFSDIDSSIFIMLGMLVQAVFYIVCSLVLIVMLDVPWQLYSVQQKLKMTKQELKDELKDQESSAEVKSKLRAMQQKALSSRMLDKVPACDAIITNPTHYAVAIIFEKEVMHCPHVAAKGVDMIAANIVKVAKAHNVPILEIPPLSRALYWSCDINDPIPEGLYTAIAQVLAYIYQMQLYQIGQMPEPVLPTDVIIPKELQR